ncbi:MAG: hypothetical protein M1355_02820 [Patescibacteria group bacterium]|nr:hypothetical protein [Patescibacteria group bacterium]MCL5094037.1 hypothetical protein [Patescibacteria group bacterium]
MATERGNGPRDPEAIYRRAFSEISARWKKETFLKRKAAANFVVYKITGLSPYTLGLGGPSVREHVAKCVSKTAVGRTYREAMIEVRNFAWVFFGPITDAHVECFLAHVCHDNDPEDIHALHTLIDQRKRREAS